MLANNLCCDHTNVILFYKFEIVSTLYCFVIAQYSLVILFLIRFTTTVEIYAVKIRNSENLLNLKRTC